MSTHRGSLSKSAGKKRQNDDTEERRASPSHSQHKSAIEGQAQALLMGAYAALPNMEDVQIAIDNWFSHDLVDTRSFDTKEELYDLWNRVYDMQASPAELAFLFAFLVGAGASSLTHTAGMDKRIVEVLYSSTAARLFVTKSLEVLHLVEMQQQQQHEEEKNVPSDKGKASELYDWKCLSRCPPILLEARTHSILCCFFHQARLPQLNMKHGNLAIKAARRYGLFEEIEYAAKHPPSSATCALHWYGLRRLHFDITVYSRLAISTDNPEQCLLLPREACRDPYCCSTDREGRPLPQLALDFQKLKLILSEVRAMTYGQIMRETSLDKLKVDDDITAGLKEGVGNDDQSDLSEDLHRLYRARRIIAADDVTLALMARLPSWVKVDARSDWASAALKADVLGGTSIINLLWARYACNRLRTESLLQGSKDYDILPELQARALEAAQDTLFLLAKVLVLLRTTFSFAFARDWIYHEAEWAIGIFNQIIRAEIRQDMVAKVGKKGGTYTPSQSSAMSTTSPRKARVSSNSQDDSAPTSPADSTSYSATSPASSGHAPSTVSSVSSELENTFSSVLTSEAESLGKELQLRHPPAPYDPNSASAKDKSYKLFAWYIFGFDGIYSSLQDLQCFGPELLDSCKMLKRLRVPRPIASAKIVEEAEEPSSSSKHSQS